MCEETVAAALKENKINDLLQLESEPSGRKISRRHIFQAFEEQVFKRVLFYFLFL
jgi:hypothetical protein